MRMPGDDIVPAVPQWVHGSHPALNYRGNSVPRHKMWFQRDEPLENGWLKYSYTGWQNRVMLATSAWGNCPIMKYIAGRYDGFCDANQIMRANHAIVTTYNSPADCIGAHSDKARTIFPSGGGLTSMITVVKLGPGSRRFIITALDGLVLFDKRLEPGTAVIMPLETNLATKNAVPAVSADDFDGPSGSIVFRSISTRVSHAALKKTLSHATYKSEGGTKRPSPDGGGGAAAAEEHPFVL
jgi:hypothetical protein